MSVSPDSVLNARDHFTYLNIILPEFRKQETFWSVNLRVCFSEAGR